MDFSNVFGNKASFSLKLVSQYTSFIKRCSKVGREAADSLESIMAFTVSEISA